MSTKLILLAHPDDEMLCLPFLLDSHSECSEKNYFLYLTYNSLSQARKLESDNAIELLTSELGHARRLALISVLRDGLVWKDLRSIDFEEICSVVEGLKADLILSFAHEGGHQDHDLAHAIGKELHLKLGIELLEFSGYRRFNRLPFFLVSKPLVRLERIDFSRKRAIRMFLRLAMVYKSQFKVWAVLGGPILLRLMIGSTFSTRSNQESLANRDFRFLYELRGKAEKKSVENALLNLSRWSRRLEK